MDASIRAVAARAALRKVRNAGRRSNSLTILACAVAGLTLVGVVSAPSAQAEERTRVAILDSGLWSAWESHPEFRSTTLVAWRDFEGASPTAVDPNGHGTAVASLAVGATLGTAPGADLIVGRVLDANGNLGSWQTLIDSIDWAVASGADVINVSIWARQLQPMSNPEIADAIARAREAGVLTIWIAGNDYDVFASPLPATTQAGSSSPQALFVGSADQDGKPSTWSRPDAEMLAWGENVTVARPNLSAPYESGLNGTSFAAPQVSGLVARLIADGAPRDPDWLEWVILHESLDDEEVDYLIEGYGVLGPQSISNAIAVARGTRPIPGPDERDAFHVATAVPRTALTGTPPRGIVPPLNH